MKNKDLIEKLSKLNPDAEVGYEREIISYVSPDDSGCYIDLGWAGELFPSNETKSTGVYIAIADYTKNGEEKSTTEVICVSGKREKAEKMLDWAMKFSKKEFGSYSNGRIEVFF